MSFQIIPQEQSSLGKILTGAAKGFAEQAPKEAEHYRLSQGLKNLGKKTGLSPLEFATEANSIYGMKPEMVNQFGKLARLQAQGHALSNQDTGQNPSPLDQYLPENQPSDSNIPSITTRSPIDAAIESYVPPTDQQIMQDAALKFKNNAALYQNDPNKAVEHARRDAEQNRLRNEALIERGKKQNFIQDKLTKELKEQAVKLGVEIPPNVYSKLEDEAINSLISKKDGGRGLTEQEARKEYGDKLDNISKNYRSISTLKDPSFINNSASDIKSTLKSIRNGFKDRGDLENYALKLISDLGLSPGKAFSEALPVSDFKDLNNEINKLPRVHRAMGQNTTNVIPRIASVMGKDASPLAISEELNERGYDGREFLDYVNKNRKSLDISERQGRELEQKRNTFPSVNDLWFYYFSGLDPLKEIE